MYTLRFPLELQEGHQIGDEVVECNAAGREGFIQKEGESYALIVRGFESEESAEGFLLRIRTGLAWLLLKQRIPTNPKYELQTVSIAHDPIQAAKNLSKSFGGIDVGDELHAVLDGTRPAIYPTEGKYKMLQVGAVSVIQTAPGAHVAGPLIEGMGVISPQVINSDERLQTALDLYSAYFNEQTSRAGFITLVMVLETLAIPTRRPAPIQEFLDGMADSIKSHKQAADDGSEEAHAFESLEREIFFRRDDSIRSQIRGLVLRTLDGAPDALEIAKKAVHVYDKRSTLVHSGSLPERELSDAVVESEMVVRRVLVERFIQQSGSSLPRPAL